MCSEKGLIPKHCFYGVVVAVIDLCERADSAVKSTSTCRHRAPDATGGIPLTLYRIQYTPTHIILFMQSVLEKASTNVSS